MKKGWVRLHRKIEEWPLYFSEPFTKTQAWIDLFLMANHDDGSFFVRGNQIHVKRGQIGWSELNMASRWKWSRKKVRNFLKWLEKEQQIEQQKIAKITTIVTIKNYESHQQDTTECTTEEQQKNNRGYTNKNEKNEKNEKNNNTATFVAAIKLSKILLEAIKTNYPNFKTPTESQLRGWQDELDKMIRLDGRTESEIEKIIGWVKNNDFWKANILSAKKLRKQYDTLVAQMGREPKSDEDLEKEIDDLLKQYD